jgi:hypothetical protein
MFDWVFYQIIQLMNCDFNQIIEKFDSKFRYELTLKLVFSSIFVEISKYSFFGHTSNLKSHQFRI